MNKSNFFAAAVYLLVFALPLGIRKFIGLAAPVGGEYATVFFYGMDLLIVLILVLALANGLVKIRGAAVSVTGIFLGFFGLLAFLSVFFANFQALAIYQFIRLALAALAAGSVAAGLRAGLVSGNRLLAVLGVSAVLQSLVGIAQFFRQAGIGLRLLGESVIGPQLPGVAKIIVENAKLVRAYGTFPHPNLLAAFLLVGLGALFYFWLRRPSLWRWFGTWKSLLSDVLIGVGIFILALGLLLSFSRAGWLIAVVLTLSAAIYALAIPALRNQGVRFTILMIILAAMLFISFKPYVLARGQFHIQEPSVQYRFNYLSLGFYLLTHQPFGIGMGNQVPFAVTNELYQKFNLAFPWQWQPVHNLYLLVGGELGVIGLMVFLVLLGALIIKGFGSGSFQSFAAILIFCSLLLFGLFDHFLWTLEAGRLMFWLTAGILIGVSSDRADAR